MIGAARPEVGRAGPCAWSCCTTASRRREEELIDWCKDRIAGYKRPRSVSFIREEEMPRTATGKILHRVLRTQLSAGTTDRRASEAMAGQDLNATRISCAAWIARFLKARGVDRIFGLQGGHIQPIWDHVARLGIRIIDVPRRRRRGAHGARPCRADRHARRRDGDGRPGGDQHGDRRWPTPRSRAPGAGDRRLHRRGRRRIWGRCRTSRTPTIMQPVTRYGAHARVADQVMRELDEAVSRAHGRHGRAGAGPISKSRPTCCATTSMPRAGARRMDASRSRRA